MKTLKYSKQREVIREALAGRCDHPTADNIYTSIKQNYPNISLGTVYRNLNLLVEIGEAIKIPGKNGSDRFDATTEIHYHFVCESCGEVSDIDMPIIEDVELLASKYTDSRLTSHEISFYGICKCCADKENASKS